MVTGYLIGVNDYKTVQKECYLKKYITLGNQRRGSTWNQQGPGPISRSLDLSLK